MGEIFDCLDVEACCSLSVITTLEFLEHHFAKVGHRLAPYDPTLSRTHHYCRHHARESVRREAAAFKRASGRLMVSVRRWPSRQECDVGACSRCGYENSSVH